MHSCISKNVFSSSYFPCSAAEDAFFCALLLSRHAQQYSPCVIEWHFTQVRCCKAGVAVRRLFYPHPLYRDSTESDYNNLLNVQYIQHTAVMFLLSLQQVHISVLQIIFTLCCCKHLSWQIIWIKALLWALTRSCMYRWFVIRAVLRWVSSNWPDYSSWTSGGKPLAHLH